MSAPQYGRPTRRPRPQQPARGPAQQQPGGGVPAPSGEQPQHDDPRDAAGAGASPGSNTAPAAPPRR